MLMLYFIYMYRYKDIGKQYLSFFFSFTLECRGNLVLGHCFPDFPRNFRMADLNATLLYYESEKNMKSNQISFALYPVYNRVGRGNLILRHSVHLFPTFRRILEALRVEWRNSSLRFSSTPEQRK